MKKIGEYWVPNVDTFGFKKLRKTRAEYEDNRQGRQISHLAEAIDAMRAASGDTVFSGIALDAGANVGAYARHMAGIFAHVHAFEPARDTYECLARNVAEWGLTDKITTYANAVSSHSEWVKMGASFGRRSISRAVTGQGDIPAISLDSLNLAGVTFLKLDVEGYEEKVLAGAARLLASARPYVMMEVKEHVVEKGRDPLAAHHMILNMGYRLLHKIGMPPIDWLYAPTED
jgi:FkbM family methyltransferase